MSKQFFNVQKGISLNSQASPPLDPSNGDMYFDSSLGAFRRYESGVWKSFTKGTIDYILNGVAESDTSGFSTYADVAGPSPVDGTGGVPNVTLTRTTSSPLRGVASFLFTKDAVNRQGQGASYDFTIDPADQARVLNINFDYLVESGTFAAGSLTTNSDVKVFIYDVTNNVLIEPSTTKLLTSSTTITDRFNSTFQTAYNSTSYRLILHCATTSALAFGLKIDNISVSPSQYVYGTPITDWVIKGAIPITGVTTNPTKGTVSVDTYKVRRVGDSYEYDFQYAQTAAGASGSGDYIINLPFSIDLIKTPINSMVGKAHLSSVPGVAYAGNGSFYVYSATQLRITVAYTSSTNSTSQFVTWSSGGVFAFGSAGNMTMHGQVTLSGAGLTSSVQMSENFANRDVALFLYSSSVNSASIWNFGTANIDTIGGWNGSTTYTVRTAGRYKISGQMQFAITASAGQYLNFNVNVNGSLVVAQTKRADGTAKVTDSFILSPISLNLKAGDTVTFGGLTNYASVTASTDPSWILLEKEEGNQTIAATETILAKAIGGPASVAANTVIVPTNAPEINTHGSLVNGRFTAPTAGYYKVSGNARHSVSVTSTLYLWKDGVQSDELVGFNDTVGKSYGTIVWCNANQILDVRANAGPITYAAFSVMFEKIK